MAIAPTTRLVIQLRRGYSSHWEKYKDVVPAMGEPCFVIDKNILKIGDGNTKFCDLKPINSSEFEILQSDFVAVKSEIETLQEDTSSMLSRVESAVHAIEVVEF